jgi:hypothetical protein
VIRSFARVADWHPVAKASQIVTGRAENPASYFRSGNRSSGNILMA